MNVPRRGARRYRAITLGGRGWVALCVVVRGVVAELEAIESLGGGGEPEGGERLGSVKDGGSTVVGRGEGNGSSDSHWAGCNEYDVFVSVHYCRDDDEKGS